ncbi:MAG TPA: oligosaccharide flippase family protein [Solirubrobacteraceae bacterium]|nr:oligosaccharide flippase family protein [Solirubrobacteraceae bacterium]
MSSEPQPDRPRLPRARALVDRVRKSQLGGLAYDTGFVAIWQGSIAAAGLLQIVLLTHAFGLNGYGRLSVVIAFGDLVGGLFNLRVSYAATTYGSRWLTRDPKVAAGVFQYSMLIDLASTIAAVPVLAVLAFAIGTRVAGPHSTLLIIVYALSLVGPALSRMSYTVLRLLDRFALISTYQWAIEFGRVGFIFVVIQVFHSLLAVIAVIAVSTAVGGIVNVVVMSRVYRNTYGIGLGRSYLNVLDGEARVGMRKTMFHTLVIQYARVVQTQLPTVFLGALAGNTQVGIYKLGTASTAIIGKIIQPASQALLPRISKLWAAGRIHDLRTLVFRASAISTIVMGVAFAAIVVFRNPVLHLLGSGKAGEAAATCLILGTGSQALYGLVFWHSTVLFAADRSGAMSRVSAIAAVTHVIAMFALIPLWQANGAALSLVISQVMITICWSTLAVRTLRSATDGSELPGPVPATPG